MTISATEPPRGNPLLHLGPGSLYVVYIFYAGTTRSDGLPGNVSDKLAHFVGFAVLVPMAVLAFRYIFPRASALVVLPASIATSSGLGALLEVVQSFLTYRSADVLDWFADTAGAIVAGAVVALAAWVIRTKLDSREDAT